MDDEERMSWLMKNVQENRERIEALESRQGGDIEHSVDNGIRKFVEDEVAPNHHYERVVAIGFYLEQVEGQDSFTNDDISNAYSACRVQRPAKIANMTERAEDEGWLMRSLEANTKPISWRVTGVGQQKVKECIQDES